MTEKKAGKQGKTKGHVSKRFNKLLEDLREFSNIAAAAILDGEAQDWNIPRSLQPFLTTDLEIIHKQAFNRDDLNQAYQEQVAAADNPGTNGDVLATKLQISYMAAAERAYRTRHLGYVRAQHHSAGRSYGQANGTMFKLVLAGVTNAISAGGGDG